MVTRQQSGVSTSVGTGLIGVINAGSSSLKFTFYDGERPIISGQVEGIGARVTATALGADGKVLEPPNFGVKPPATPSEALPSLMLWAKEALGGPLLTALGHRVVHGGLRHARPERVTPELLSGIGDISPAGTIARIAQPRFHPNRIGAQSCIAAGGLFRHCIPPKYARGSTSVCPAAGATR